MAPSGVLLFQISGGKKPENYEYGAKETHLRIQEASDLVGGEQCREVVGMELKQLFT